MLTADRYLRDDPAADGYDCCVRAVRRAELLDDALDVVLDRVRLDHQAQRDLAIGETIHEQFEHLLLASRQWRKKVDTGGWPTACLTQELIHELFEALILALQLVQHLDAVD